MGNEDRTPKAIGLRLKALRLANGFDSQIEFAKALGVGDSAYNSWETGAQRPGLTQAFRVVDKFGVSLDFLYRGHLYALPDSVKKRVILILNTLTD